MSAENKGPGHVPEGEAPVTQTPIPGDIVQHMLSFLRKHGFTDTEEALSREASQYLPRPDQAAAPFCPSNDAIINEFGMLMAHIDSSFDFFQAEIAQLIFPAFAHCYIKLLIDGSFHFAATFMEKYALRVPSMYEEQTRELSLLRNSQQAMNNLHVQQLMKQPFVVRMSKSAMKQMEPLLSRLPAIASVIKEHIHFEASEYVSKLKTSVDWQGGGILGQMNRNDRRHKVLYGIQREECVSPLDKRRFRLKEESKKREMYSPQPDRIPLPPLSDALRCERAWAVKEYSKMAVIGPDQPPSVCLYTTLNAHGGVSAAAVTDDSGLLALGFGDAGLSVFALNDDNKMRKLKSPEELDKLDVESDDVMEEMFDVSSASASIGLSGHAGTVCSLDFSPEKRLLLSTSTDRTIRLWSMATQTNVVAIRTPSPIWQAVFCQRGYYYATGSASGAAAVWTTERMQPLRVMADPLSQVGCVHFHPNCNYIVGGSDDRYVRVWDILTGTCVRTFSGHRAPVRAVKFSPCGRYISSVSSDGVLCIWDMHASRLVGAETRPITTSTPSLCFSREGGTLAVSRGGPSIALYSMDNLLFASCSQTLDFTYDPKIDMPEFETHNFATKQTPVVGLHFTRRNLLLGIGAFNQ